MDAHKIKPNNTNIKKKGEQINKLHLLGRP
jgi:hypothetical protein